MVRRKRPPLVWIAAARLAGDVARRSDGPRTDGADYRPNCPDFIDELRAVWLAGWDEADRREREGLPAAFAPPSMINTRQ